MDRRTAIRTLAAATAIPFASTSELATVLEARRSLACEVPDSTFRPAALSDHELAIVRGIADIILPRTDTPGASDVGVHEFIDLIVSEWFDLEEAERFTSGLVQLDETANTRHGADFLECPFEAQVELVTDLDDELADLRAAEAEDIDETFFHWMKRLTLTGYFTSEEGMAATQHRRIPGAFEGCLVPEPAR